MHLLRVFLHIFMYVVVVCPISEVVCVSHRGLQEHAVNSVPDHHHHRTEEPCDACPRHGKCVPRVQCPAHLRHNSYNPLCHIGGQRGLVGVCCFTGSRHAAEADVAARSANTIRAEDIKIAHNLSRKKLAEWLHHADKVLEGSAETVLNASSPSFAHHLSVMTYEQAAEKLGRGGLLNLFAAKELKARDAISDDELMLGLTDHADGPFCPPPPACPAAPPRYRSVGGECNNPAAPAWGAVHTAFERLLPPHYGDGIWSIRPSSQGQPLPSARVVSSSLVLDAAAPSATHNLMFMQLGQFIAHDTSAGVVFTIGNGSAISCCVGDGVDFQPPELMHWACAPVATTPDDPFYAQFGQRCLNLVRTQLAPASDCAVGYAKQMNGATHYLDLSHLYGNSPEKLSALRSGILLNTFNDYGRELPPLTQRKECMSAKDGAACFESGDNHGNQIISLTILHTIWTREHNRIARVLARLNSAWTEDTVFYESRRLLQAEFQHVVYNEWLPLLLGPRIMQKFGLSPSPGYSGAYDPHVNPSLTAEFSAAAMRFGHSVVDSKFVVPNAKSGDLYEAISIPEVMFQPSRMRLRPFLDRLIAGLIRQPMQTVDPFVTESLTRYLFHGGSPFGLDLASINVQRGRDYGLRSYNEYRRLVGLPPYADFRQFPPSTAHRLSAVYQSPDDIDLWIGGLLEEPAEGGVVGATFANILADQFSRFKRGDRYFYENGPDVNPGAFTPSQLAEIKKVSLSRLLCDNRDGIELLHVAPNAFLRADLPGNEPVPCDSPLIPSMDLNRFREV
ncbi:unnamed protein product [Plutella xylostella]|uniref:(diamondback moth) hypothetical protein n=1 Tax=Plutella xylostella TaxID=51655 RepID=A0A8S4F1T5_PLUXY|nr:unnamed protein product [Plutella xylostella]